MSARSMAWGWLVIFSGILENKNAAKLVLLRFCDRADPDGICWPGHNKTAADLGLSKTIVKESVKLFESLDLLRIQHRMSNEGDPTSNLYILNLNLEFCTEAKKGVGQPVPHPESAPGGALSAPPVGQPVPQGGALADPELKKEPVRVTSSSARVARVPAQAQAGATAAAGQRASKARRERASGLVTWDAADRAAAERIEQQIPADELAGAVAAERAAGLDPLPGRVAARLQQQRQKAQSAAAAEQAERRAAAIQAESRRRGDRELAELMAAQAHQTSQGRDP